MIREEVESLSCVHEEADTKHINQHMRNSTIVVWSCDTDVLVILLTHAQALGKHLWLDVGINSNNTRRYINITELDKNLGSDMCKALPGLHAFTGCDYTAALMRKGKVCMLAMVEKSKKFQEAFGQLGESRRVSSVTMTTLETFVTSMASLVFHQFTKSDTNISNSIMHQKGDQNH